MPARFAGRNDRGVGAALGLGLLLALGLYACGAGGPPPAAAPDIRRVSVSGDHLEVEAHVNVDAGAPVIRGAAATVDEIRDRLENGDIAASGLKTVTIDLRTGSSQPLLRLDYDASAFRLIPRPATTPAEILGRARDISVRSDNPAGERRIAAECEAEPELRSTVICAAAASG